jgi:hypothetical protein
MLSALDDLAGPIALVALIVATVALLVGLAAVRRSSTTPVVVPEPPPPRAIAVRDDEVDGGRLDEIAREVASLREHASAADDERRHAIQHIGLVRFNPFDDTGGNQSFSLALLDENADGVVLSSLHSRTATRMYVKAILGGRSDAPLSDEEQAALRDAGLQV